jgi:hypothetical protein
MPDILRIGTPMGDWRSFAWTNDVSNQNTGTFTYLIEDTICIMNAPSTVQAGITEEAVYIYHAEKIMIRKMVGSGQVFAIGQRVYCDLSDPNLLVTPINVSGSLWIGICVRPAAMNDVRVMIDLKGDKAT